MIQAGAKVDAGDFAFTSWTPSWVDLTLGSGGTQTGWYTNVNGLVNAQFYLVFGTSPSFGGAINFALPVPANVTGLAAALGSWVYRLSGTSHYTGTVSGWDGGGVSGSLAGAWTGSVPNGRVGTGTTTPTAPSSGNIISATLTYRAA